MGSFILNDPFKVLFILYSKVVYSSIILCILLLVPSLCLKFSWIFKWSRTHDFPSPIAHESKVFLLAWKQQLSFTIPKF